MPAIVWLQADRALCPDDLLEGRGRQLAAARTRRVARADDQDIQPVDPMPADPRVRPRATAQPVGTVQDEGAQARLAVECGLPVPPECAILNVPSANTTVSTLLPG